MGMSRMVEWIRLWRRSTRSTLRVGQIAVLGLLAGLLVAAADPPGQPAEEPILAGETAPDRQRHAGQLRLIALSELCPQDHEILLWQIRPDHNEVRIAFARSTPDGAPAYATPWNDLVLVIDRGSLPGLLMAQATEPMATPTRGSGVGTWDRWLADSRVQAALLDRETVLQQGWIPHTDRRNPRSRSEYLHGVPNRTPVAPFSGR